MKFLVAWPKATPVELRGVMSGFGEMIASSMIYVSIVVFRGNTLMLEQRSHDVLEGVVELVQNDFVIGFDAV